MSCFSCTLRGSVLHLTLRLCGKRAVLLLLWARPHRLTRHSAVEAGEEWRSWACGPAVLTVGPFRCPVRNAGWRSPEQDEAVEEGRRR